MKESEITALAREYAEEMIKGRPSEELPNCLKNSMLTMNTEYIAEIFQWLLRRFALVEKSRVEETYNRIWNEWNFTLDAENKANCKFILSAIASLFPEIGKEVES